MILNVALLGIELLGLALLALVLHASSRRYGLAPILIYLSGLVVILHGVSPLEVQLAFGTTVVNTSSVTLVPVILTILLVLYVVEGTASARLAIIGVIGLSFLALGVQLALTSHMHLPGGRNAVGLPVDSLVFDRSWFLILASILALSGSLFTLLVVHQGLSTEWNRIPAWAAPGIALLAALLIDEVIFRTATLSWLTPVGVLPGTLLGKLVAGVLIWPLVAFYLGRSAPALEGYAGTANRRPLEVLFGSYKTQELDLRATREERRRAEQALKASEVRFKATFEQAGVGLAHADTAGRVRRANRALCEMLGYPEEELQELTWADITHPEDLVGSAEVFSRMIDGELQRYEIDKRYVRKDGSSFWGHATGSVIRDEPGEAPYLVVAIADLTERIATEGHLRQAQKMEAVGQLTGGIAHDFNNLLTVIMGALELGMDERVEEREKREVLADALTATKRGASLTQRLLAFSRKQTLKPTALDATEILNGMHDLLVRTLGETVRIRIESGAEVASCMADRAQLENAVLNLCLNARDAMPGGGELLIRTDRVEVNPRYLPSPEVEPGSYVQVAVADQGTGIPAGNLGKIFDPFFTTKDTGKGSGLGLSMVYGFARQSGGFVTVQSQEGAGTSIQLHLPVA